MSSSTSLIPTLLSRAKASSESHTPLPLFPQMLASRSSTPSTILISCVDPRVVPEHIFHLDPSDGVIVFRTIAGHPQPALSGILALDTALGIEDILILHHSDCGSTYFTEDGVRTVLKGRCPGLAGVVEELVFGATENGIEQNLKDDAAWLRGHPLMREELARNIRAFMWDVQTGTMHEV